MASTQPGAPASPEESAAFNDYLKAHGLGWATGNTVYSGTQGDPNSFLQQVGNGHPINAVTGLAKSPGYDTAAQGAKDAQAYLQQLSQTAWDRQMQGLQGALGQFQGYDALKSQLIPSHANPGGGMPGGPGAGGPPPGGQQPSGPPLTGSTGYISPRTPTSISGAPAPPIAATGYSSPRTPTSVPSNAPPELPPPGSFAPPSLPPPGAPPSLPPPGMPAGAPPVLPPPGGATTPNILAMLSAMTRGGRGSF